MSKRQILIADDEIRIREALERWFRICGFDVDTAADGVEAVEKCRSKSYDVVTMDLEMPRLKGFDAIAQIREFAPDVPFVVLTGYPHNVDRELRDRAARFLTKPARLKDIEKAVQEILEGDAAAAE